MTSPRPPQAVIIAGPNGAGKSTLAPWLLAKEFSITTFVNADTIAQGLAGFDPASAAIQAGRIVLDRLDELRHQQADFAFETTLSGLAHQRTIQKLHASGYETHLVYLWLPGPELAVERVRIRVQLGGHDVPEQDVRRRYFRSVRNFEHVYRRSTSKWRVYYAARPPDEQELRLIARGSGDTVAEVHDPDAWREIRDQAADQSGENQHGSA
jgi:predicted ABC-type ATPase